ncbi:MAG TPA: right-handed parallel beta-helix repeat-containing protein [Pirellulales bacterium]|nr:right-handed parallel beta-helix repeat-containing protein [Pirellulales bacterium]
MSDVRDFGASGDGQTDDTAAIRHCLKDGDGVLLFSPGTYVIRETIAVELNRVGRFGIDGSAGTAKLLMTAAGPAFHLVGTHDKNADPKAFKPEVWQRQRMPTVLNVEIEGRDPAASGFLLEGTMQATFEGVLLRELDYGIRVLGRNRNLLVSHCHIYNNHGIGIHFDRLNLHQAIITGSHISYCKRGGIRIEGCEIRNLQITGNDIEYNFDTGEKASADIWIDSTADGSSVREGTIASNTIQAKYSPGGANIRMLGYNAQQNHKAGMFSITGNLIGSQETNVHLVACRGVVVSGNVIYSGHHRNLLVEGSRNIIATGNSFDHNPDYQEKELCTGVRFVDSHDCNFSDAIVHDCQAGQHTVAGAKPIERSGLVEIVRSQRMNLSGCQVLDGQPYGIHVEDSSRVTITGCSVLETHEAKRSRGAIRFQGSGSDNYVAANSLAAGTEGAIIAPAACGVKIGENLGGTS